MAHLLRLWCLLAIVSCTSEPLLPPGMAPPRDDVAPREVATPVVATREAPAVELASASPCQRQLDQALARPKDRDFDQLVVDTIASCARECDDSADGSACAVLDQVVRVVCTKTSLDCAELCLRGKSQPLRTAMCKHKRTALGWRVGDRVSAQWGNGSWYPGRITLVRIDGTYDVAFDDGDRSRALPNSKLRAEGTAPKAAPQASSRPRPRTPSREGESCAGVGWQHRCGGVCVDIKVSNDHCGGCGRRCEDGYHCDGSATCRNASGGL